MTNSSQGGSRSEASKTGARRSAPAPAADSLFTPLAILNALRRRWKVIAFIAVPAALLASAAAWKVLPSAWTSYALLRMASIEPKLVFETAEAKTEFTTYRQTQTALITSRFVLNAALGKPGIAELETLREAGHPIGWLETRLDVSSPRSPEIIRIALTGERPEELAMIVNAVKDAYLEEVVNAERKARLTRLADLERIFAETDEKVRAKQSRVEKLAKQLGSGDSKALTIKQQMALEYFATLQREHARVRFELMHEQLEESASAVSPASDRSLASLDELDPSSLDRRDEFAPPAGLDAGIDPGRLMLARRIVQLRELVGKYEKKVVDPNHPSLVEHRRRLAALEAEFDQPLPSLPVAPPTAAPAAGRPVPVAAPAPRRLSRHALLQKQETALREELERYSDLAQNIGTSSFELESMQTELAQVVKVADRISGEIEALKIELQSPPRVALLQTAEVPQTRDLGKKVKLTGLAGSGTMGLFLAGVLFLDLRRRRIASTEDLTVELQLPLLGTVPPMSAGDESHGGAEAVDAIRALLLSDNGTGNGPKSLLITSATAGEGKTTLACALARSFARAGRKTLLVDFDLRRPGVHAAFGLDNDAGVNDVLASGIAWQDAVAVTEDPLLTILPAGPSQPAAIQALARGGARRLFEDFRAQFDAVVIDSAPLLLVSDAAAVGRYAEGAILVARRDESRVPLVAAARDRLAALGIPLLGAILAGVRSGLPASYAYQSR